MVGLGKEKKKEEMERGVCVCVCVSLSFFLLVCVCFCYVVSKLIVKARVHEERRKRRKIKGEKRIIWLKSTAILHTEVQLIQLF